MYLIWTILAAACFASAITDGSLQLHLEKRPAPDSRARLRWRDTDSIDVQIAQNGANRQEYIIHVVIGTPGQRIGVTLDTGSSDLWVPSAQFCQTKRCDFGSFDPSASTSYAIVDEGNFNVTYAAPGDSDAGDWVTDAVSLDSSVAMANQIFGLSNQGYDAHGVLGVGFGIRQTGSVTGDVMFPAVIDNLFSSQLINRRAYSLYLNAYNQDHGSIVFGGIDSTKFTGDLVALPLQSGPGSRDVNGYFVTLSRVTFTDAAGTRTTLTPDGYAQSVLLDSGTSFTALTDDVLEKLAAGMGALEINDQGTLVVPCHYNTTNATISYTLGGTNGVTVTVPISETIGLQLNTACYFGFAPVTGGFSVLGDTFLRSAYAVFDIDNQVAALAQAVDGQASTSSIVAIPAGTGLPGVTSTASAMGTQLPRDDASGSPSLATASTHRGTIVPGTPTFNLGTFATGVRTTSSSTAAAPSVTGVAQVALWGVGAMAGMLVL